MKTKISRNILVLFFLITFKFAYTAQQPVISMTVETNATSLFIIKAVNNNTNFQIDFGDGVLVNYVIDAGGWSFSHRYLGQNVKIYGGSIRYFSCYGEVTSLNVTNCPELVELQCSDCKLTSLDISQNINLTELYCDNNHLTGLDISKNTKLTELECGDNSILELDCSNCPFLEGVYAKNNSLTKLEVAKCLNLKYLQAQNNKLTKLEVSKNTKLVQLFCENNLITKLDLKKDLSILNLHASNNKLDTLYVGSNDFEELYLSNNSLTIEMLPGDYNTYTYYSYTDQAKMKIKSAPIIDLSAQAKKGSNYTSFTWTTTSGTLLVSGSDYITTSSGVFIFTKPLVDSIYCTMKNASLPLLTLITTNILPPVTQPNLSFSTTAQSLALVMSNNYIIDNTGYIDWGFGTYTKYKIDYQTNRNASSTGGTVRVIDNYLTEFNCYNNKVTNIDVTNCPSLIQLNCGYNLLRTLDVSKNPNLNYLYCSNNYLNIATLPQPKTNFVASYTYSQQYTYIIQGIQNNTAVVGQKIDLSSQLNALDLYNINQQTSYTWKTKGGNTLVNNVHYSISDGVTTFLLAPTDSVYCEMKNNAFPLLTLKSNCISIKQGAYPLAATLTTTLNNITITLSSSTASNTVKIDWGNGILVDYVLDLNSQTISGSPSGTVAIYGQNISSLNCSSSNLVQFALNGSNLIKSIACTGNMLTIATLPRRRSTFISYEYSPQSKFRLPRVVKDSILCGDAIDLNSYASALNIDSVKTTSTYVWKTKTGVVLQSGTDYSVTNNVFFFLKKQTDSVYCEITNSAFPNFTQTSRCIFIYELPQIISLTNDASNKYLAYTLSASKRNNLIQIDAGGARAEYVIDTKDTTLLRNTSGALNVYGNNINSFNFSNTLTKTVSISTNNTILALDASNNYLLFSTLPQQNKKYTSYVYSPQKQYTIPESKYRCLTVGSLINFSSEMMIKDINNVAQSTTFTWKLKSGTILTENIDYMSSNGIFYFVKSQPDSVYCEMTNSAFANLTIKTCPIEIYNQWLSATLSTKAKYISIGLTGNKADVPVQIDWGNGTTTTYFVGTSPVLISNTTSGLVKIYCGSRYFGCNLTAINCSNNQVTKLTVNEDLITSIACDNNYLSIGSLPQRTYNNTYNYKCSPQGEFSIASATNRFVNLNEIIDLSSEASAYDLSSTKVSTIYTWKTANGKTLISGIDYSISGGIIQFLRDQPDSVYCEMTNTVFPGLKIRTNKIAVGAFGKLFAFSLSTSSKLISLALKASEDSSACSIDWGNNSLIACNINKEETMVTGSPTGVAHYYSNNITSINCRQLNLNSLAVSSLIPLKYIDCRDNNLTFSTLPAHKTSYETYNYSPQNPYVISGLKNNTTRTNIAIDLSAEQSAIDINGLKQQTLYEWQTLSGTVLNANTDYTITNGTTTFINEFSDSVICKMTNAAFPGLTLITRPIKVVKIPLALSLTSSAKTVALTLTTASNNSNIQVDWGDGVIKNYTIGNTGQTITITVSGTVKIYADSLTSLSAASCGIKTMDFTEKASTLQSIICNVNSIRTLNLNACKDLKTLNCSSCLLSTLIIDSCTNLNSLNAFSNSLSTINLTNNLLLTELTVSSNKLTSLDVSSNNKLTSLSCAYNKLTILNLKNNNILSTLYCYNNSIANLNLSNLLNLSILEATDNMLNSIDVTNNTSLTSLDLSNNNLTLLDVSKNILLKTLHCTNNKLSAINLSNNTALSTLDLSNNFLKNIDIKNNKTLMYCYLQNNYFTIASLPIPTSWFFCSPQANYTIPNIENNTVETQQQIDLANQLYATNSINQQKTTVYVWKTKAGTTLTKNVDYTEQNGKFIFLKELTDSVYCEMTNPVYSLTLKTNCIKIILATTICFHSQLTDSLMISVASSSSNSTVSVDWGDGLKKTYTVGTDNTLIKGLCLGIVKVYGTTITTIDCSNEKIDYLKLSNSNSISSISCNNNPLLFSTLPRIRKQYTTYVYSPLDTLKLNETSNGIIEMGKTINLSNEKNAYNIDSAIISTIYICKTITNDTLVKDSDYVESNGKITFIKTQEDSVTIQMQNPAFPGLNLTTNYFKIPDTTRQYIDLNKGWNLISFFVSPRVKSIDTIFKPIIDKVVEIKNSTSFYRPGLPDVFNSMKEIDNNSGYLINVTDNVSLTIYGFPAISNSNFIQNTGWKLIGYPFLYEKSIDNLFSQGSAYISIVKNFDEFKLKSGGGSLSVFKPGKGYFVK